MKLSEVAIDEEHAHLNYVDSISNHIQRLGNSSLAKIAGTSSSTGLQPSGFVVSEEG
jgi:bacterioferritin